LAQTLAPPLWITKAAHVHCRHLQCGADVGLAAALCCVGCGQPLDLLNLAQLATLSPGLPSPGLRLVERRRRRATALVDFFLWGKSKAPWWAYCRA
jgi:hypothetical protein